DIGYETGRARTPRLVYASGSGFGSSGPYVGYAAMDFTIQALVGAMSITGFPDQPPVKCGPTFIDMLGATHLFAGILLALRERERTGIGQRVEVAMFDAAVPTLLSYLAPFYELQREMSRSGNRHVVPAATGASPSSASPTSTGSISVASCNARTSPRSNAGTASPGAPPSATRSRPRSRRGLHRSDVPTSPAKSLPPASRARQCAPSPKWAATPMSSSAASCAR